MLPSEVIPTPPHHMTARQLGDYLTVYHMRNCDRLSAEEREVLWELLRRVEQHERLISEVLPDLRNLLTRAGRNPCPVRRAGLHYQAPGHSPAAA
jgi:hypothetical protein